MVSFLRGIEVVIPEMLLKTCSMGFYQSAESRRSSGNKNDEGDDNSDNGNNRKDKQKR